MAGHHSQPPVDHGKPYEVSDADVHQLSVWTGAIFVTMFVAMALMAAMVIGLLRFPLELGRTPTPMEMDRSLPPTPRLQVNQADDLAGFRAAEDAVAGSYGRQPNSGAVRIPVNRAIEILAEKGLTPGRVAEAPKQAARAAAGAKAEARK